MKRFARNFYLPLTVVVLLAALRAGLNAQETDSKVAQNDRVRETIGKLEKLSSKERVGLLSMVVDESRETQASLLLCLDSEQQDVKFYAAFLLGYYKFEDSVSPLAENITLEDNTPRKAAWYWLRYPAADALVRIGKPSEPAMIEKIETSSDKKERYLAAMVINGIEGQEVARFILQQELAKQTDSKVKARLQTALKNLREFQGTK